MRLLQTFEPTDFGCALLTVFIAVVLLILIRLFGKLPVSLFGLDLNLLTYGYLWDTALKALRNQTYWPRLSDPSINKAVLLFVICLCNFIFLAWNMKILDSIEKNASSQARIAYTNWVLKPLAMALGLTSVIAFIGFNSLWGY
jgi:hypothetical protein